MRSKIIIILVSILFTFFVMSAGYGSWNEELTVTGSVYVIPK